MNILEQKPSVTSQFIRGGRIRKTSKNLISFAPFLVGASVVALGAVLATGSPVGAGSCDEVGTTGEWNCSNAENSSDDGPQVIMGRGEQNINITGDATFGLHVLTTGQNAQERGGLTINSVLTTGTIDVNLSNGNNITSELAPITLRQEGTGAVTVTANGTITSTSTEGDGYFGIGIHQQGTGAVTVTASGTVSATGRGIHVETVSKTTGEVYVAAHNVTAEDNAIHVDQNGNSTVTVITTGTVTSTTEEAIDIDHSSAGDVNITTAGTVTADAAAKDAIRVNRSVGGNIAVTVNGSVSGGSSADAINLSMVAGNATITLGAAASLTGGIDVSGVTGTANLEINGTVTSTTEEAIAINHSGEGDVDITTTNTVTATVAAKDAIRVNHTGIGNITLTVNGSVVGGSSANAINLSTAAGNATIILGSNANFEEGIDVSGVTGTASLEIGGTGNRNFDIGNIPEITGDRNFDKNGDHTLTVTGIHAPEAAFAQTNINEGKLVWEGTDFRTANLAIADGATLGITGNGSFTDTSVALSGRLDLTGNDSNVTVNLLTGDSDSDIDIDVDFSGGDTELPNARLTAASVIGTIPVNIKSLNEFRISNDDEDGVITLENFLDVTDFSAFEAGDVLGNRNFGFDLVYDSTNSWWNLVAYPGRPNSIEEALYESLPAALAQLASLESYRQRLQGKRHGGNRGVWAKLSNAFSEFEPVSTTLATYETRNTVAEFGIDAPLRINYPCIADNCTVSASVAFGEAATDVVTGGKVGEIKTSSVKTAISANWKHGSAYVDGQLQYAIFINDIKTDVKLANESANAYSAGVEVGYGMDIAGFRVVPAAQLLWTSVDFGTFTDLRDPDGRQVELNDGSVLAARTGVGVEYDWNGVLYEGIPSAGVLLRGHADVFVPMDGSVGTRVDRAELTSEREDPALDVGVGTTYAWGDAYALSADVSVQQGGEVKGYTGSVGFKYKF